jgi:N6-adenosine-specific RNA methylase IME4
MALPVRDDVPAPYQVMPPLAPHEFEALKADIAARGVQVPVEYDEADGILDGHHRVAACLALGITQWPRLVRHGLTEEEKRRHARRLNLDRRHLSQEQRRELISAELRETPAISDRAIASGLGVDHKTVGAVREAMELTGEIPQLKERQGRDSKVRKVTLFVPGTADDKKILKESVKKINAEDNSMRRDNARKLDEELSKHSKPLIASRRVPVILADPATRFESGFSDRSIENHYPTDTIEAWCKLPVKDLAWTNCILFCWTTVPHLANTIEKLIPAWGFEYKSCLCWDKVVAGTGYWARNQHELLLIATCGDPQLAETADRPASMHSERKGEHSAKPEYYRELIERMTPDQTRMELFARSPRPGWISWGNQSGAEADGVA